MISRLGKKPDAVIAGSSGLAFRAGLQAQHPGHSGLAEEVSGTTCR
jgi:hypothetical protein